MVRIREHYGVDLRELDVSVEAAPEIITNPSHTPVYLLYPYFIVKINGGKPPYHITLHFSDGVTIYESKELDTINSENRVIPDGRKASITCLATVRDADGREGQGENTISKVMIDTVTYLKAQYTFQKNEDPSFKFNKVDKITLVTTPSSNTSLVDNTENSTTIENIFGAYDMAPYPVEVDPLVKVQELVVTTGKIGVYIQSHNTGFLFFLTNIPNGNNISWQRLFGMQVSLDWHTNIAEDHPVTISGTAIGESIASQYNQRRFVNRSPNTWFLKGSITVSGIKIPISATFPSGSFSVEFPSLVDTINSLADTALVTITVNLTLAVGDQFVAEVVFTDTLSLGRKAEALARGDIDMHFEV